MRLETRIEKLEQALSVSSTHDLDEASFERLFKWMSDMGLTADRQGFFDKCRERGIHSGPEYMAWLLNKIGGRSLGLPQQQRSRV